MSGGPLIRLQQDILYHTVTGFLPFLKISRKMVLSRPNYYIWNMEKPIKVENLWQKLIMGDRDAFLHIYQEHYVGLMNYGSFYFKNRGTTNDAIVEMLLNLWDKRTTLPQVKNVRSYLISCLRFTILQNIKTEKWKDSKANSIINHLEGDQPSHEEQLTMLQSNDQLKRKLHKSFEKLSDRQKELLQLKFFENMGYEEIAASCNITKRTAYNIIHDAIKILRAELNDGQNNISMYDVTLLVTGFLSVWEIIKH